MTDDAREWYYADGREPRGPFSRSEIAALVGKGAVRADTFVWADGMADWVEAQATELAPPARPQSPTPPTPPAPSSRRRRAEPPARPAPGARAAIGPGGPAPAMGFKEAVTTCLKQKYATFSGRGSRSEYWYFLLFYVIANVVTLAIDGALFDPDIEFTPVSTILGLALFVPSLSVTVRRLHDTDRSAWWLLLGLAPFVAAFGLAMAMPAITVLEGGDSETTALVVGLAFLGTMLAAFLVLLVFMVQKGTPGPNRYG